MRNIPLLIGTLVGTLILIVVVAMMFSKPATQSDRTVDQAKLAADARLTTGGGDTPQVTVVEFSDLQCPACKAVSPLFKQLKNQYGDRVKIVFRHFPLTTIHPYALLAAQASEVAHDNGKFWEMHDLMFERQQTWSAMKSQDEVKAEFAKYAEELAIDKQLFLAKIESDEIKQRVAKDLALGNELKIQATPTIFVNGTQLSAPERLISTVESLLK